MTKEEMKEMFGIIAIMDPKARFATDKKTLDLQLDVWVKILGDKSREMFQNALIIHYGETPFQPGPMDILKIVQRLEGEERRRLALVENEREKIEYKKRLEITQTEIKQLRVRPDYNELRAAFAEKYTKRFPLTAFIEEEPEALDANVLYHLQHGFYHFEIEERGLIETDDKKLIAAPVKFLPKETSPFRRLEPPVMAEREETQEEAITRQMNELKNRWKDIEIRKRADGNKRSVVEIVEEVAKEADERFKLEVA